MRKSTETQIEVFGVFGLSACTSRDVIVIPICGVFGVIFVYKLQRISILFHKLRISTYDKGDK